MNNKRQKPAFQFDWMPTALIIFEVIDIQFRKYMPTINSIASNK